MLDSFTNQNMFPNRLKFNANKGKFYCNSTGEDVEITFPKKVVMDLEVFTHGWNLLQGGAKPQFNMAKHSKPLPKKPLSDEFKMTFCIRLYNKKIGLCEFQSQSNYVQRSVQNLQNDYLINRPDDKKVPVVTLREIAKTKNGKFQVPIFQIEEYIDRPEGLTEINVTETKELPKHLDPDDVDLSMPGKPNENQFDDNDIDVPPHMDDRLGKNSSKKKAVPFTKEEEDAEMAKLDAALGLDEDETDF
tara:strand:+ start:11199 stop:11936 length:738 start_codon:yes stop_codon:yes gene_type:complete